MEKKSKMKTEKEVAEQTLRDDLEVTGSSMSGADAESDRPESLVVYAVVAAIVLAITIIALILIL